MRHTGPGSQALEPPAKLLDFDSAGAALEEGSNHRLVFHGIQAAGGVAEEAAHLEERHGSQRDLQLERMKLPSLMRLPMPPLVPVLAEGAVACIHV